MSVVLLSVLVLLAYVAVSYLVGRLVIAWLPGAPPRTVRTSAPLVGACILALQLWAYGAVRLPWSAWVLMLPWLALAIIFRRRFLAAMLDDWHAVGGLLATAAELDALETVLVVATVVIALIYLLNLVTQPVLVWDAIAMWLFKAKLYFTLQAVNLQPIAGDVSRNLNYPPLFSLMVATLFTFAGRMDDILGKSVNFVFFVTAVPSLLAITWTLLGRRLAIIFAFLLAAMPMLSTALIGPFNMGMADYPVGILMLMSLIHLVDGVRTGSPTSLPFTIFFASMAAMTKDEGFAFLVIVLLVVGADSIATFTQRRSIAPRWTLILAVLAVLPVIAWQVYFRAVGVPGAAHLSAVGRLGQLLPTLPDRALGIVKSLRRLLSAHTEEPWIAGGYLFSAILIFVRRSGAGVRVLLIVSGELLSYFLVYLVTPSDLGYIIFTTFDRLVLQIAPSVLLLLAVALHPYMASASATDAAGYRLRIGADPTTLNKGSVRVFR
jgi:hypothetical protein